MESFPRLYSLTICQDEKVGELWQGDSGGERWRFHWRRELFVWERELLDSLKLRLEGVVLGERVDTWFWKLEREGGFLR